MIEHVGRPDRTPARYYLAWRVQREIDAERQERANRGGRHGESDIEVLD